MSSSPQSVGQIPFITQHKATPKKSDPPRADGSDKYYGLENVTVPAVSSKTFADFVSLAALGMHYSSQFNGIQTDYIF